MFTFLRARGLEVGASLVEEDKLGLAIDLEQQAQIKGVELLLPSDVIVADRFAADAQTRTVPIDAIPSGWMVRTHIILSSMHIQRRHCADQVLNRQCSKYVIFTSLTAC